MDNKLVFLLDFDGTCYDGFSPLDLAESEVAAGLITQAECQLLAHDVAEYKNELINYEELSHRFVDHERQILAGKKRNDFVNNAWKFYESRRYKIYYFLPQLVEKYKDRAAFYFISSGFDYSLEVLTAMFNFNGFCSNTFLVKDGYYTEELPQRIDGADTKNGCAVALLANHPQTQVIGFGDSIADVGIFEASNFALGVNASIELQTVINQRGWMIVSPGQVIERLETLFL
jgi:phosphoserine phosphatase